uniref:PWWP domain-containing protein n=1 Tax=Trichogramma kaykai TaxID=54128 RepID=A0ABD2XD78_9HYME
MDTIRLYLQNIDIDSEEIEYIKNASIQLIKSNTALYTDKPRTNTISQIEGHPINGITDDEETLPPIPDMPLEHVDPPSVVSIPVDQGFLSRYSPNEVVLGKRFKSYFWPAQIIEVHSDNIYVTFFPLSKEMEKEEVSSEEDVRAFTDEEIEAAGASLYVSVYQKWPLKMQ